MKEEWTERARALLGDSAFERLAAARIAVFGVGGVGGWCAEALLRTGARHLTLIDDDAVAPSNINRQRQAIPSMIGRSKVEVLREILLEIAPDAQIDARNERYAPQNAATFDALLSESDFVIDAIDSVDCKAHLIRSAISRKATIFSSMGAALRFDPTRIRTAPFHKVTGDGLARALRNRFRKEGVPLPHHLCVYSEESPRSLPATLKGSIMPVTCAFGMALASLVISRLSPPRETPPPAKGQA